MNDQELVDYIALHINDSRGVIIDEQILWDVSVALYRYGYGIGTDSPGRSLVSRVGEDNGHDS